MDPSQVAFPRLSSENQGSRVKDGDDTSHGSTEATDLKLAHTLSACTRCRKVRALVSSRRACYMINCSRLLAQEQM